jgi:hypothetical protein
MSIGFILFAPSQCWLEREHCGDEAVAAKIFVFRRALSPGPPVQSSRRVGRRIQKKLPTPILPPTIHPPAPTMLFSSSFTFNQNNYTLVHLTYS